MRCARGYLLLELLVAVAIFATLAALAWGGLDAVVETQRQTERAAARLAALQRAVARLERDLGEVAPRPVRARYGELRPALAGGSASLELSHAAYASASIPRTTRLARSAWVVDGDRLVRRSTAVLDRAAGVEPVPVVLLDAVESLALRYLDAAGNWQTEWPLPNRSDGTPASLPRAVEITLRLRDLGEIQRVFELPDGEPP